MDTGITAEPLHQYGRMRTSNADVAEEVVSEVFEPHRLTVVEPQPLQARLNAVQTGSLTLGYLAYGTTSEVTLPPSELWYHVNITLTGTSNVIRENGESSRTVGLQSGAVLLPHRAQRIEWQADATQFALKVPRPDLEGHLSQLIQRRVSGPLDLGLTLDLTGPAGKSLLRAVQFVGEEWDEDGILSQNAHSRRQLQDLVLTNLLLAASGPHQTLLRKEESPQSSALETTIAYIHDHAAELPTLTDLIRISGVSARTLQLQFERGMGCTPLQYLRDVRLRSVRQELLDPQSDSVTVTDVATRWGFYNHGRFSALYRKQYGELPSETLRRSRA